ncbi:MAG: cupin domain-containing protein [Polaromonas sp.]|uniref:cupin domain-containing protein n=1 Tax=Polaromonas sp. TaxID=1869339 RepID=UPI00181730F4|nr:cupin domain-containing protein [Polaromonas sp.]MBA3594150.1 cupin domain-containing protein [Polaromonas sp.]
MSNQNRLARLDRLSALLHGLAPRSQLTRPQHGQTSINFDASAEALLRIHVFDGPMQITALGRTTHTQTPAFWICRADTAHTLAATGANALVSVVSANVFLDGPVAPVLLAEFAHPRLVALDSADDLLANVLALVRAETAAPRCGQPALLDHAADMLFIGLLRHLVAQPQAHSGLFAGLSDPRIAAALVAMHEFPGHPWSLEALAKHAGMSRTAFAVGFKSSLNRTPGKYLSGLRLHIARREVEAGAGLKAAARAAGYGNVSALSRALGKNKPMLVTE